MAARIISWDGDSWKSAGILLWCWMEIAQPGDWPMSRRLRAQDLEFKNGICRLGRIISRHTDSARPYHSLEALVLDGGSQPGEIPCHVSRYLAFAVATALSRPPKPITRKPIGQRI